MMPPWIPSGTASLNAPAAAAAALWGMGLRHVKTAMGKIPLAVRRVQCSLYDATHALLPSSIVPYSQILLSDHAAISCLMRHLP